MQSLDTDDSQRTDGPTVRYLGSFRFPDGDAAAARVLGTGKALRDAGARVIFGGWEKEGRPQDRQLDGSFEFEDFQYVSLGDLRHSRLSPARRLTGVLLAGRNTLNWIGRQSIRSGDVVVAYHGGTYFLTRLHRWCRVRGIRLVVDCTEWYSPRQLPGGQLSPAWWNEEISMRLVNPNIGRLMVISSYLEQYYSGKGCAVLRVPPLIDLQDPRWRCAGRVGPDFPPLRLAYAGTPGRKDLLSNVLRGLLALRGTGDRVMLTIIGPTRSELVNALPEYAGWFDALDEQVIFDGPIQQSAVPPRLMAAHFTVLLRRDERFARAGFPTKVVESLGAGVPVITNATSDLASYITDGSEGVLLEDDSTESFVAGVRRLLTLGPAAWQQMRAAARRRAESAFDFRVHTERISRFVLDNDRTTSPQS